MWSAAAVQGRKRTLGGSSAVWSDVSAYTHHAETTTTYNGSSSYESRGVFVHPDGDRLWNVDVTTGGSNCFVREHTMSTPHDITTLSTSSVKQFDVYYAGDAAGLWFSPDGVYFYTIRTYDDTISRWTMSTPWDITTAVGTGVISGNDSNAEFVCWSPDGQYFYRGGRWNDIIERVTTTTPWVLGGTVSGSKDFTSVGNDSLSGVYINNDGTRVVTVDTTDDIIRQYNLSTPWDITTAGGVASSFTATGASLIFDVHITPDYTNLYLTDSGRSIIQYKLV